MAFYTQESVASSPAQTSFNRRSRLRSYSNSSISTVFRPLSFLSLTPSPRERRFSQLIDSDEEEYQPIYTFSEFSSSKCSASFTPKAKSRFTIPKLTMPSWSISKSSRSSRTSSLDSNGKPKPKKEERKYVPAPFFNAVNEYQFLEGGDEDDAIAAVLRERGLNMSVAQAREIFWHEKPGGYGINWGAAEGLVTDRYRAIWCPYEEDDSHSSASSDDTLCSDRYSSSSSSSMKKSKSKSYRPPTLQLPPPTSYSYNNNFVSSPSQNRMSQTSFMTSSSATLYEPSIQSSASKNSKGVRSFFGKRN